MQENVSLAVLKPVENEIYIKHINQYLKALSQYMDYSNPCIVAILYQLG